MADKWKWIVGGFIAFFAVTNPGGAATVARGIGSAVAGVATGIGNALVSLFS